MSLSPSPPPKPVKKKAFLFKRANLASTPSNAGDELSFFSRNRENYVGTAEPKEEKEPEVNKKHTHSRGDGGGGSDRDRDRGGGGGDDPGSPPKRAKRRSIVGDEDEDSGEEITSTRNRHANARERYGGSAHRGYGGSAIPPSDSDSDLESSLSSRRKNAQSRSSKSRARDASLTPPPVLYAEKTYPKLAADPRNPSSLKPTATVLSDDEDDLVLTSATTTAAKAPIDEDAEMLAAIEARARARVAAAAAANSHSGSHSTPPPPDSVISILVSSDIEGTRPLVVRRRINQSLKIVRFTWCARQGFTDDQAADIFLTWKGNKVFDHNTCRGIGIGVGGLGGLEETEAGESVHFEAMTTEMWGERERERERKYTIEAPEEVAEMPEVIPSIKLTFKSKGYEDFKLKVRPDTKISKIISAFRESRGVEEERVITLNFDGDTLDPDETVGDTELEDNFGIDVYIN